MAKRTFKTHLGNQFTDTDGQLCRSWQLVCNETGTAFATLDLTGARVDRFLFADSVADEAKQWRDSILEP